MRCNERVKFADLMDTARELGAEALATGHYVRRVEGANGAELHRAVDPARDQSYFLFATTQKQLDYLRFPIGEMDKREVRAIAAELGLIVADKPDSQDICFVPDGKYANIVQKMKPDAATPGDIVDGAGNVLGRHDGVIHFTVGQRKGLGLSGNGEPLFVLKLDAAKAQVVVGTRDQLSYAHDRAARRQLARRRRDRHRLRREGALHAPAGRCARHSRTGSHRVGRTARARRSRRAGTGLRLLRARRHARARRRLDRASGTGAKGRLSPRLDRALDAQPTSRALLGLAA